MGCGVQARSLLSRKSDQMRRIPLAKRVRGMSVRWKCYSRSYECRHDMPYFAAKHQITKNAIHA
ncbi:hypothetical protein BKA56DRAFT_603676 [Ilyonectria sp. MPI-CAGE-AT-0026]|nr:hypothetical protein BKA56DRAFT_603676 [Ilyonectria sp. MPI-CAGE-AT-0026]